MEPPADQSPSTSALDGWTAAAEEDRAAWEARLARHLPWIREHVHKRIPRLIRMKAETGDVVQDALLQFLRYGPRFELSDDHRVRALLARIIENVLRDKVDWFTAQRREVARERPLPPDSILGLNDSVRVVESTSRIVEKREAEARVRLALELLDPQERAFIVAYDWEGLSFSDLGERHGISKSEARRRYLRSSRLLVECVRSLREGRVEDALDQTAP